jgi:hypothetical protein
MIDATERLLNLINGFNNIARYNAANNIPPSRELLVAQDYINNKIDSSDIFNPYLNIEYLNNLKTSDEDSYEFIINLLDTRVYPKRILS